MVSFPGWFHFQDGFISKVVLYPGWFHIQDGFISKVILFPRWSYFQGGLISGCGLKACIPLHVSVPHSGRH